MNRFGAILGFAHAGMTAEGDNRVLMQKVLSPPPLTFTCRKTMGLSFKAALAGRLHGPPNVHPPHYCVMHGVVITEMSQLDAYQQGHVASLIAASWDHICHQTPGP